MSLEFMDNFSNYGTDENNLLDGVYAEIFDNGTQLTTDPDGVSGGMVLKMSGAGTQGIRKVLSAAQTTVGIAVRTWISELPNANAKTILVFRDAANADQVTLQMNSTGTLSVTRGSTVLNTTTVPVITAAAWNHIEMKVLFSQTVGTIEVRVNGVPKIDLENQDTCNTALVECSQIVLTNLSNNHFLYMKDLYIWNDGGSIYNDFVGDVQIVTLLPDTDVSLNWTPSTGLDGSNLIDETTPDDTDYISADDSPPAAFVCELTDLDSEVVSVKGLMIFSRMLKTDGGTATVQNSIVSNGDDGNGADRAITVAATYWMDQIELDPDTAAAWSPIAVNNARLKINRTL